MSPLLSHFCGIFAVEKEDMKVQGAHQEQDHDRLVLTVLMRLLFF